MNTLVRQTVSAILCSVAAIAAAPSYAQSSGSRAPIELNIPAQSLEDSLLELARQASVQLVISSGSLTQRSAPRITGTLRLNEALDRLLRDTDLGYKWTGEKTLMIAPKMAGMQTISMTTAGELARTRLAEVDEGRSDSAAATSADVAQRIELEEVLVTGSHIRGAQNLSSPVITFTREDIEASGYSTTQQFIRSLPQNLGSVSDTTVGQKNGGPGAQIAYDGSAINLRGLGSDATLVLLDGRRLAAAGDGSFVDVSLIPLNAIERIEVLTDGASAIYGSDAVAGVVNLILRKDFQGAETRLRYGAVSEGSRDERQIAQMLGGNWGSGRALLSYEYHRDTALHATDRDFIKPEMGGYADHIIIPGQERHGALVSLSQRVNDAFEISSEVLYRNRESRSDFHDFSREVESISAAEQYGGSVALQLDVTPHWQVRLSALRDHSESDLTVEDKAVAMTTRYGNATDISAVDLVGDGALGMIPGGQMRLALGAHFRSEEFEEWNGFSMSRDITAAYGELVAPLVGARNRRQGLERLELSIAGRYEDYSDFGSTFNPKMGAAWMPINGLNIRSTWGTSFKAPLFVQMAPGRHFTTVFENGFADQTGAVTGMQVTGTGVRLGPEESTNFTFGLDIEPIQLQGLKASATYFDIRYEDRIQSPFVGRSTFAALLSPESAPFVTRNPSQAEVAAFLEAPNAFCFDAQFGLTSCDSLRDQISVIVDSRLTNIAEVRTSGVDFSIRYQSGGVGGSWMFELAGTRLMDNNQLNSPGAPEVSIMNDVWRPVDLRLRNTIGFTRGPLSFAAMVNYSDDYRDRRASISAGPNQRPSVGSWTTVDSTIRYDLGGILAALGPTNTTLTLSVTNIFDRAPPFVSNREGFNYDGVNASPLGRFVSAQITTTW